MKSISGGFYAQEGVFKEFFLKRNYGGCNSGLNGRGMLRRFTPVREKEEIYMPNWKSFLINNTPEWLLESNNPSVKYFTLIDLLDNKPDSSEVIAARSEIMAQDPVMKILNLQNAIDLLLSKQNKKGRWLMEKKYYRKFHTEIERKGNESKWVTLYALTALKNSMSKMIKSKKTVTALAFNQV